jgi:hypothetical protein
MRRALPFAAVAALVLALAAPAYGVGHSQGVVDNGKPVGIGKSFVLLSYDLSANSEPASVSGKPFVVSVDVVPSDVKGFVRVAAFAPNHVRGSILGCRLQPIVQGSITCNFTFTMPGKWSLKAQYFPLRGARTPLNTLTSISVAN